MVQFLLAELCCALENPTLLASAAGAFFRRRHGGGDQPEEPTPSFAVPREGEGQ